jgi:hypothetical protein
MASSFKTIDPKDIVSTRNLLHEAIPITGTILSGTYGSPAPATNVKNYTHGMFQSVYDYPYLSSSANHIMDLTVGYGSSSALSSSSNNQNAKKINIYNEMAQVLAGFDQDGAVRAFDEDGDLSQGTKINEAMFLNFTRLLAKDEIKKGSFSLELGVSASYTAPMEQTILITDASGSNGYKVNSPAGEYGILFAKNGTSDGVNLPMPGTFGTVGMPCGLLYYQAGIAVISSSVFSDPTYLSASKMVVKNNSTDSLVSYTTAVGLYSADNELLAVAKLSEPLKKDPSSEFTLRVRLDY